LKKPRFAAWLFHFYIVHSFDWQDSIFFSANKHGISPIPFLSMRTDALYLNLFETAPSLALHLAGYDFERASEYTCHSEELKKTFRVDAVLTPPKSSLPLVMAEVQFQREVGIYARLVSSCAIMQLQTPEYSDIRMVIFFANRSVDTGAGMWQPLVESGALQVVYLDEATASLLIEQNLSALERALLLLARVTVSPYDRMKDDAVAVEFGQALVPIRSERQWKELHDFFVNLYLEKYATITYTEILTMIASSEIFDGIGNNVSVREYAEAQVQKATQEVEQRIRIESALAMLDAGIPLEQVASILHLPVEQIIAARA
jgi:predicted transposase YdaD